MANTRFKGETAGERLDYSGISDSDMIQLRHKPGTINDSDKGISKANLLSCPFGVSDTAAGTVAKTASLTDSNPDFSLVSGREVVVCFTTANSASAPTLNFAGSGAYPIYYPDGSAVGVWAAGTWMHLKYFSATVGGNAIQRWILLSLLPVDTVALNNMQSVTSNAVAKTYPMNLYANEWQIPIIPNDYSETIEVPLGKGTWIVCAYCELNVVANGSYYAFGINEVNGFVRTIGYAGGGVERTGVINLPSDNLGIHLRAYMYDNISTGNYVIRFLAVKLKD